MKRVIVTVVLILLVASMMFSQAKPGGLAREVAMGGSQAGTNLVLNPFIYDDPSLVLVNPAYQAMYKDYLWMNIAGGQINNLSTGNNGYGHQNAGVAFKLNDAWNIGAIFSYDPSFVNGVGSLITGMGGLVPSIMQRSSQSIPAVQNVWEALASTHMGSMDLGLGVMYGWSNSDSKSSTTTPTSSETEASSRMIGFRAGLNMDLGEGNALGITGALRMDKATDKRSFSPVVNFDGGTYTATATELQFSARAKFKMSNKFNFVPYGLFATVSGEPKEDVVPTGRTATTTSIKVSGLAYALGVGGEYKTQNLYLAGGLSWQNMQMKAEVTSGTPAVTSTGTAKYTALPVVNLGAEWWFTDWLAGRAGYYRSIGSVNQKFESPTGTSEWNSTGFVPFSALPMPGVFSNIVLGGLNPSTWDGLVTLGIGMKFGGWALDATVSEEALRRGLGLIGAQDNINTFGYLTASFNFAE
jgi:hypothetical protein